MRRAERLSVIACAAAERLGYGFEELTELRLAALQFLLGELTGDKPKSFIVKAARCLDVFQSGKWPAAQKLAEEQAILDEDPEWAALAGIWDVVFPL